MPNSSIVSSTKAWVRDFIVAHNICPFARRELERNSIHYQVCDNECAEEALLELVRLCKKMDGDDEIETALFIFSKGFLDFEQYLDLLDIAGSLLVKQGYEGVYQLASFHPDYCFDGVDENDASNFTNRSPYPMFHIIREESLEAALTRYPNPEAIPERNVSYCKDLGESALKEILQSCYQAKADS